VLLTLCAVEEQKQVQNQKALPQTDIFSIPGAVSKMVRVKIDDPPILMSIKIPNENLTCGWLISEV